MLDIDRLPPFENFGLPPSEIYTSQINNASVTSIPYPTTDGSVSVGYYNSKENTKKQEPAAVEGRVIDASTIERLLAQKDNSASEKIMAFPSLALEQGAANVFKPEGVYTIPGEISSPSSSQNPYSSPQAVNPYAPVESTVPKSLVRGDSASKHVDPTDEFTHAESFIGSPSLKQVVGDFDSYYAASPQQAPRRETYPDQAQTLASSTKTRDAIPDDIPVPASIRQYMEEKISGAEVPPIAEVIPSFNQNNSADVEQQPIESFVKKEMSNSRISDLEEAYSNYQKYKNQNPIYQTPDIDFLAKQIKDLPEVTRKMIEAAIENNDNLLARTLSE